MTPTPPINRRMAHARGPMPRKEPEPRLAARIAALQAAATFAAGVVLGSSKPLASADVLRVADAFVGWLEQP